MADETPRLPSLPEGFARTRASLHRVAEQIVAPARKPDNEISLGATPGGFGTPPFEFEGHECQVRVDGVELVFTSDGAESRAPLDSLKGAAEIVADLLPDAAALSDEPLEVDESSARALAAWYALGDAVLARLREGASDGDRPSPSSLWPEHFDIAIELGDEQRGRRANYGFSPGDADHDQPYLYVGPWAAELQGELWNARGFTGAELDYSALVDAEDQVATALDFCRARKQALDDMEVTT